MLYFPQRCSRQIVDEDDFARNLETCELRLYVRLQVLAINASACLPDDISHGHFVPTWIGPANDAAFGDSRMFQQHPFDLRGIDVLTAGYDQIFLAVMDPEITVSVAQADITSAIPAVVERFAGCGLVAPIFIEHVGSAYHDFAGCACRQFVSGIIDNSGFAAQAGKAGGPLARQIAAEAGVNRDRAGLGR